jgi:hypothetical protein
MLLATFCESFNGSFYMQFCKMRDFAEIEAFFHQQFSSSLPSPFFSFIFSNSQLSDLQFLRLYKNGGCKREQAKA